MAIKVRCHDNEENFELQLDVTHTERCQARHTSRPNVGHTVDEEMNPIGNSQEREDRVESTRITTSAPAAEEAPGTSTVAIVDASCRTNNQQSPEVTNTWRTQPEMLSKQPETDASYQRAMTGAPREMRTHRTCEAAA